jgi:murein L,D-transpeptidase YafK
MKKLIVVFVCLVAFVSIACAQPSFVEYQKKFPRVAYAMKLKEDTLKKQFEEAGLVWPAKEIYIRSFKYDSQMEVWVRNSDGEPFKLFKTYKVCALAGTLGPKRMAGDYQVPEGFYYINEFNPKSTYHLSLGLNYPNPSDRMLGDSTQPGGEIYIHGSCVTVGCIPIMDAQIEELYILAANAKNAGQDFIPVHIFPVRYNNAKSMEYFSRISKDDQDLQKFAVRLKEVYDYFEKEKKLPLISINKASGEYVVL